MAYIDIAAVKGNYYHGQIVDEERPFLSPWLPNTIKIQPDTINVFFHPGTARTKVCRQGLRYDAFVPSILFLTHFLPDSPKASQMASLCSLMLGGNGIWGDVTALSTEDIALFRETLDSYKRVADAVTRSYPRLKGFIGSSPEIYEKIEICESAGLICFFTRSKGIFVHVTQPIAIEKFSHVTGADDYVLTNEGRLKITVHLSKDESRPVFTIPKDR